jgi:hypothetical protein
MPLMCRCLQGADAVASGGNAAVEGSRPPLPRPKPRPPPPKPKPRPPPPKPKPRPPPPKPKPRPPPPKPKPPPPTASKANQGLAVGQGPAPARMLRQATEALGGTPPGAQLAPQQPSHQRRLRGLGSPLPADASVAPRQLVGGRGRRLSSTELNSLMHAAYRSAAVRQQAGGRALAQAAATASAPSPAAGGAGAAAGMDSLDGAGGSLYVVTSTGLQLNDSVAGALPLAAWLKAGCLLFDDVLVLCTVGSRQPQQRNSGGTLPPFGLMLADAPASSSFPVLSVFPPPLLLHCRCCRRSAVWPLSLPPQHHTHTHTHTSSPPLLATHTHLPPSPPHDTHTYARSSPPPLPTNTHTHTRPPTERRHGAARRRGAAGARHGVGFGGVPRHLGAPPFLLHPSCSLNSVCFCLRWAPPQREQGAGAAAAGPWVGCAAACSS